MSRSTDEAKATASTWLDSDAVGMLLIHKGPRKDCVVLADETIKMADLDAQDRAAVNRLLLAHAAFKVEATTGKDGPDRIKVTRQL